LSDGEIPRLFDVPTGQKTARCSETLEELDAPIPALRRRNGVEREFRAYKPTRFRSR
jgi:hypothetical protein